MSLDPTTTGLLKNMKRRAFLPAGSGLTTADLLEVLSEQLRNYIPAFLKGLREEYLIASVSLTVTGPTVPAPARACGAAFRGIEWTCADRSLRPLDRIEPERRAAYALTDSQPVGYMFKGNDIILVPAVTSGVVVLSYQQRPGQLVLPSSCGLITVADVDAQGGQFTVSSKPTTFTDSPTPYDFVSASGNFIAYGIDFTGAGGQDLTWSGNDAILAGGPAFWAQIAVGDYLCLAGETCIPQLPSEVHDLLAQAAAYQVASDTGSSRLGAIKDALKELREQVTVILAPRNSGSSRPIVSKSGLGRRMY